MLPLLSLHALAAQRGDGLRPELKALFERHARPASGLAAAIEPVESELLAGAAADVPVKASGAEKPSASVSCSRASGQ
ncbi:hypothetical protein EYW47_24090 [Paraburkholderia silviterrae]|uniref:Uncharacterized protein n=1 Tax=Paraburkholderia silviterrae TaxID=2528715 RepID=A0A4R5M538_9BURK|nr:hypothetical protein EYW47_24090 [Paraburkholderia silviterrae]